MRPFLALALGLSLLPHALRGQALGVTPSDAPLDPGPLPTRNMFTLLQAPMTYQPQSPQLVGVGRWRVSLQTVRANVFEFSDLIKDHPPAGFEGRVRTTRDYMAAVAAQYKDAPFVFFFDEEIQRTTLQVRTGLGPRTDVWMEVPVESHSGGWLDGPIETFHKSLGFGQWGREEVARNQALVAIMRNGRLDFYDEGSSRPKLQDPLLGLVHQLSNQGNRGLALTLTVKPPLTKAYGTFESGWDAEAGLSGWWRLRNGQSLYYGAAWTQRGHGNASYTQLDYRSDLGAHLTWQGRPARVQPFVQLYFLSGFSTPQPFAKLHDDSLQHDLGVHVHLSARSFLTFRYVNNITHHENTDDASFGLGLTTRF